MQLSLETRIISLDDVISVLQKSFKSCKSFQSYKSFKILHSIRLASWQSTGWSANWLHPAARAEPRQRSQGVLDTGQMTAAAIQFSMFSGYIFPKWILSRMFQSPDPAARPPVCPTWITGYQPCSFSNISRFTSYRTGLFSSVSNFTCYQNDSCSSISSFTGYQPGSLSVFPSSQVINMVRVPVFPGSQVIKLVRFPVFPGS